MSMRKYLDLMETALPNGDIGGQISIGPLNYDQAKGLGNTPYNQEIKYRGFACLMTPAQFSRLAAYRDFGGGSNISFIKQTIEAGKPIASPFLIVDFEKEQSIVVGHEGRTRMIAINQLYPDQEVLVHIFPYGSRMRARHLSLDMISAFRHSTIAENQSKPIAGPHFDETVWWLDGWKTVK